MIEIARKLKPMSRDCDETDAMSLQLIAHTQDALGTENGATLL
jgi:hypothetical protein